MDADSPLTARVARLEESLAQALKQRDEARNANTFMLENLARRSLTSAPTPSSHEQEVARLAAVNASLRQQLAALSAAGATVAATTSSPAPALAPHDAATPATAAAGAAKNEQDVSSAPRPSRWRDQHLLQSFDNLPAAEDDRAVHSDEEEEAPQDLPRREPFPQAPLGPRLARPPGDPAIAVARTLHNSFTQRSHRATTLPPHQEALFYSPTASHGRRPMYEQRPRRPYFDRDNPKASRGTVGTSGWYPASDLYNTRTKLEKAIEENKTEASEQELRHPDLFKYGLCYDPDQHDHPANVYRTVIIDGLPERIGTEELELKDVMKHVHGGFVVSADLFNTTAMKAGMTARIVFLLEDAAERFSEHAKTMPIEIEGEQARVTHLKSSPTWPMPSRLLSKVQGYSQTRCLDVTNIPRSMELGIEWYLKDKRNGADQIESRTKITNGGLFVVYKNIDAAGHAYARLNGLKGRHGWSVRFAGDPCCRPGRLSSPKKDGEPTNRLSPESKEKYDKMVRDFAVELTRDHHDSIYSRSPIGRNPYGGESLHQSSDIVGDELPPRRNFTSTSLASTASLPWQTDLPKRASSATQLDERANYGRLSYEDVPHPPAVPTFGSDLIRFKLPSASSPVDSDGIVDYESDNEETVRGRSRAPAESNLTVLGPSTSHEPEASSSVVADQPSGSSAVQDTTGSPQPESSRRCIRVFSRPPREIASPDATDITEREIYELVDRDRPQGLAASRHAPTRSELEAAGLIERDQPTGPSSSQHASATGQPGNASHGMDQAGRLNTLTKQSNMPDIGDLY